MLISAVGGAYPDKWIVAGSGVAGTGPSNSIRTHKPAPRLVLCGDGITEPGPGQSLMAPRVMTVAGHQANAVVRIILGMDPEKERRSPYGASQTHLRHL